MLLNILFDADDLQSQCTIYSPSLGGTRHKFQAIDLMRTYFILTEQIRGQSMKAYGTGVLRCAALWSLWVMKMCLRYITGLSERLRE